MYEYLRYLVVDLRKLGFQRLDPLLHVCVRRREKTALHAAVLIDYEYQYCNTVNTSVREAVTGVKSGSAAPPSAALMIVRARGR